MNIQNQVKGFTVVRLLESAFTRIRETTELAGELMVSDPDNYPVRSSPDRLRNTSH